MRSMPLYIFIPVLIVMLIGLAGSALFTYMQVQKRAAFQDTLIGELAAGKSPTSIANHLWRSHFKTNNPIEITRSDAFTLITQKNIQPAMLSHWIEAAYGLPLWKAERLYVQPVDDKLDISIMIMASRDGN